MGDDNETPDDDIIACLDDMDANLDRMRSKNIRSPRTEALILNPENSKKKIKTFGNLNVEPHNKPKLNRRSRSTANLHLGKNQDENCVLI